MELHPEASLGIDLLNDIGVNQAVVISPLSILLSLSLVHFGAKGHTKEQIKDVIVNGSTHENLIEHFSHLQKLIGNEVNDVKTSIANRIFLAKDIEINETYLTGINDHYKASAQNINFDDTQNAAKIINDYISENTMKKITNMIGADSLKGVDAVLINAIYFQADWRDKYALGSAKNQDFHTSATEKRTIPFLKNHGVFRKYAEDEYFRVLSIPYKDKSASFLIFLPKTRFGLMKSLNNFNGERFHKLFENLTSEYVKTAFPKFKITKAWNLNDALSKKGLRELFTESADLSGIGHNVKISSISHSAMIEVDEWGTRAAAATEVKFYTTSAISGEPINFVADEPFLFAVVKESTPLFMGIFA
ncbi:unnamed protein product [Caenorhabditis bovis]|uniref:Serpin domain-containing protein n=1 Tax=Caenorhabditis bovis TaxID=2654633 RepID=A0A8S1ECC3_9PELO|nr:unnamed protein product [Caenorhabditis bovis]